MCPFSTASWSGVDPSCGGTNPVRGGHMPDVRTNRARGKGIYHVFVHGGHGGAHQSRSSVTVTVTVTVTSARF
eukprot:4140155-Pyramimonas_sp.AAC.1